MKRVFNSIMVVSMLVWVLAGVMTPATVHAASAGDLIKSAGNSAVYYLGADGKRYVFPNQNTYRTWFGNDFSKVVTISATEMGNIQLGGNVTYKPGTRMIKLNNDPKVYTVEPNGVLRHVPSEAVAADLFGANWNKQIDDMVDSFMTPPTYSYGSALTTLYPTGSLVKEAGSATVYYISGTEKRPIADMATMSANYLREEYIHTHSLADYTTGSALSGMESELATVAGGSSGSPVTSTGTLTVALASDTPVSTTVVKNATYVKFTKVNLTATGGDVTVDSMTIQRTGLAQDANFSNVYLLDATTGQMFGNEKTLGSAHTAVVNDDITITNGTTKSYYLAATMSASTNAGEVAGLALSAVVVKGSATVSASLPISGNPMTMNNTIAIGSVTQDGAASNPVGTSATSKPVGTTDYVFNAANLSLNSTEDVQVESIRFYQAGTASDSDIANLDLLVDGVVLATVAKPTDRAVVFDLSSAPYTITKGNNKTFEIRGDIVNGSGRTIYFNFDKKTDVKVKGKTYGFYITPSYTTGTTVSTSSPYWDNGTSGDYAITSVSTGTLTVSKAVVTATNASKGTNQQELGAFYFQAQGEPVIVTQVIMDLVTSTSPVSGEITNVTLYDENGVVIAGPQDKTDGAVDYVTLTDTFTVPVGTHKYVVKGDLDSTFVANSTVQIQFSTPATDITAKGEVTNNTVTAAPTSNITGDTVSVKVGDLNISSSSSPAAQTVAAGTSGYIFANFVLDASQSGEDVKISQLKLKHTTSAANIHSFITGLTLYDSAAPSAPLNTPQGGESSTVSSTATSTITLLTPLIITKGTSKTIILKGDISGSAANASTHQFGLVSTGCATVYGNSTGNSITPDVTNSDGQKMTISTGGTLRMSGSSTPSAGLILADSTNTIGTFSFEALYENTEVQQVGLTIGGSSEAFQNVQWLQLYDGSTKLGEVEVTGANATITPASLVIPLNTTKVLTLKAITHKVGTSESGTSGENFTVKVSGVEAKGTSTGSAATKIGLDTTITTAQYIFKTKPTVTKVALSGMSNDTQDLYKFTLAADSKGDVGFFKASFSINTTTATVTAFKFYEIDSNNVETDVSYGDLSIGEITTASSDGDGGTYVINAKLDTDGANNLRTVAAGTSKTYVLRGTVANWVTTSVMTVKMLGDNAAVSVDSTAAVDDNASDNFIWSDLFMGYSTSTATGANEWTNGYKVVATTTQSF